MELIDSHCHLDLEEFDADRAEVIQRAREAGLVRMITIGIDPETSARAIELAEAHEFIFATVGHHPHEAARLTDRDMVQLKKMAAHPKVVGFGEIGLDFFRNHSPAAVQIQRFHDLTALGMALDLPLIIHDRDAHEEVLSHLQAVRPRAGVIHCFSGDWPLARKFLDLGFYISIPGTVTFPKAQVVRDVAGKVPLDALLLETDAPFLAPVPRRGRRNEPALIRHTAAAVAEARGMPVEELCRATVENTLRLFRLPPLVDPK